MLTEILKGLLVGICASAPVGPIMILVIQKTMSKGRMAGFIAGMGACTVDTLYATAAIYALALVQNFMNQHRVLILILGGILVGVVGWFMTRSNPFRKLRQEEEVALSFGDSFRDYLQALAMGLSNPGAIAVIFGLFAFFGIGGGTDSDDWRIFPVLAAVCAGATVYWYIITGLLAKFTRRIKLHNIVWVNRITGAIVILLGAALLGQGLYEAIAPLTGKSLP